LFEGRIYAGYNKPEQPRWPCAPDLANLRDAAGHTAYEIQPLSLHYRSWHLGARVPHRMPQGTSRDIEQAYRSRDRDRESWQRTHPNPERAHESRGKDRG